MVSGKTIKVSCHCGAKAEGTVASLGALGWTLWDYPKKEVQQGACPEHEQSVADTEDLMDMAFDDWREQDEDEKAGHGS